MQCDGMQKLQCNGPSVPYISKLKVHLLQQTFCQTEAEVNTITLEIEGTMQWDNGMRMMQWDAAPMALSC